MGSYLERSEDVGEVEGRPTTFSGEVDVLLISLSRVGVLSERSEDECYM